jgi:hypothetical protein
VDRVLVERARSGDRDAFASLVHQVSDSLFAVAYRILRDVLVQSNVLEIMAADGSNLLPVKINAMDLSDGPQGFAYVAHWIPGP